MKKLLLPLAVAVFLINGQAISQNWMEVGSYVPLSTFNEITEFNGDLYAVGDISNGESGVDARHTPTVWKLVENTWTEIGSGFAEAYYVSVKAIAAYDSELYTTPEISFGATQCRRAFPGPALSGLGDPGLHPTLQILR